MQEVYSRLALTRLVLGPAACAAAAGFAGAQSPAAAAPRETVLYSFPGGYHGKFPQAGVNLGEKGVLYGTTSEGGTGSGYGNGTVFQLTPPATGQTQWTETVLYKFAGGYDGGEPLASLTSGANGALYGTTAYGGTSTSVCFGIGCGTVFQLTPPATGQTKWTETVLYKFTGGNDGGEPRASLTSGANGALYGTTFYGGTSGNGTVFQLTPPAKGQTQWTKTVLHSFTDGSDGGFPLAGLIFGENGALYGTTAGGGTSGNGTVFRLTPPATGQTKWTETYNFTGGNDAYPNGLIFGESGALYGTTSGNSRTYYGTVFQLTPPAKGQTQWTQTVLHSFTGGNDGSVPLAGLITGKNGALYGTTEGGGTLLYGTVFQLTPPATGQKQWTETVLYSFTDGNDGAYPQAGLIFGENGALYGTTLFGGTGSFNGTVFRLMQ